MYDVLIVGGGPGGASCALSLCRQGLRVLVLEKETIPREKPCGGGVPSIVMSWLGFDSPDEIGLEIGRMAYTYDGALQEEVPIPARSAYSIVRKEFDAAVLSSAERAGASILGNEAVSEIRETDRDVTVRCRSGKTFSASYAVGADGGGSTVARALRLGGHLKGYVATSAVMELPYPREGGCDSPGKAFLDFGFIRRGYVGLLPKNSHTSLGVYALGAVSRASLQAHLIRYAGCLDFPSDSLKGVQCQVRVIPLYDKHRPLNTGRVLLVGEAGRLVDALSGEGIRHAVRSGMIAGEVLASALSQGSSIEVYTERVRREIGEELLLARRFAAVV
ncbi:MAG: NAD(P)/FAD-dependent oxidoreductase, partial [Armatimonadetes bacterium]|nr:NAD(P)/FAD-dependent oxidoreductase [Armatimonadota bacterium]